MEPRLVADELPWHRVTVHQWHAMIDAGVLGPDDKVELIEGVIVNRSPQGPQHGRLVIELNYRLGRALPDGWRVSPQCPVTLGGYSEPEPDIAVVSAQEANATDAHPSHPVLCIEVAKSSLRIDRVKAGMYATYGVPEVWIVDVEGEAIEVYRDPDITGGRYRSLQTVMEGTLAMSQLPSVTIDVGTLFR